MNDSAPASNACPRCLTSLTPRDWWISKIDQDREFVDVCQSCADDVGPGRVDTTDWPLDDETPQEDAEFIPASEVYTGP